MNIWKHFCTINHHKILVMRGCFQVGLIRQGLLHDLSKYSPTEFIVGCKYYQGNMSPNNAEREAVGYSSAWLRHKGRNKHHLEYWIDYGIPDKEGPHKGEHKGLTVILCWFSASFSSGRKACSCSAVSMTTYHFFFPASFGRASSFTPV